MAGFNNFFLLHPIKVLIGLFANVLFHEFRSDDFKMTHIVEFGVFISGGQARDPVRYHLLLLLLFFL